jgi:hypothetical protein
MPVRGRVRLHTAQCSVARMSAVGGDATTWISATTYRDARGIIDELRSGKPILNRQREPVDCGLCVPRTANDG